MRGKTIKDNANRHLSARHLVTIDIKNFFPSITPQQVRDVWRRILTVRRMWLICSLVSRSTAAVSPRGTHQHAARKSCPRSSFDAEIRAACELVGVRYSSLVNDLAFSGILAPRILANVPRC